MVNAVATTTEPLRYSVGMASKEGTSVLQRPEEENRTDFTSRSKRVPSKKQSAASRAVSPKKSIGPTSDSVPAIKTSKKKVLYSKAKAKPNASSPRREPKTTITGGETEAIGQSCSFDDAPAESSVDRVTLRKSKSTDPETDAVANNDGVWATFSEHNPMRRKSSTAANSAPSNHASKTNVALVTSAGRKPKGGAPKEVLASANSAPSDDNPVGYKPRVSRMKQIKGHSAASDPHGISTTIHSDEIRYVRNNKKSEKKQLNNTSHLRSRSEHAHKRLGTENIADSAIKTSRKPQIHPKKGASLMGSHSDVTNSTRLSSSAMDHSDKQQRQTKRATLAASLNPASIYFGTPLDPIDLSEAPRPCLLNLMHHKDALQVLGKIRNMTRRELHVTLPDGQQHQQSSSLPAELKCMKLLRTAGTATAAVVTMTGYKGGPTEKQINHDRAIVVSPYFLHGHANSSVSRRLMGVFDGHAEKGMKFAEHCQQLLPNLLSRKLSEAFTRAVDEISAGKRQKEDEVAITKRVLGECFITLDETSPSEASGGSTATVVYQQGRKVYIANCGDSHSFVAVYRRTSRPHVKVIYRNREDKPDIPEERKRLEGRGGEIIPAEKNKSSKVKFNSKVPGKASATLSMSRSIGDWLFGSLGVIPDPIVDVLDINEMVNKEINQFPGEGHVDDVCIFAISASDGMLLDGAEDVDLLASALATSLFEDDAPHPLTACQASITKVADEWNRRNKGKFRDDITLAITILRSPGMSLSPPKASSPSRQRQK